jgi:phage baseplate assembly protein W
MSSLAVKLPLTLDSGDGFTMIKDLKTLIKQNFKMLLLTVPGERVMQPDFGAGLKRFLFESFSQTSYGEIEFAIRDQTSKYMPHIIINSISFNEGGIDRNRLGISINYSIPNIGVRDLLEFTI